MPKCLLPTFRVQVGQLVTGTVRRIEPFGVFVGIDNTRVSGLLHISNVSRQHIESVQVCMWSHSAAAAWMQQLPGGSPAAQRSLEMHLDQPSACGTTTRPCKHMPLPPCSLSQGVFKVGEQVKCLVMGLDPGYTNISLSVAGKSTTVSWSACASRLPLSRNFYPDVEQRVLS